MKYLAEFEKYLIGLGIVRPEQISCAMEDGEIRLSGKRLGAGQIAVADIHYTAAYWIEDFTSNDDTASTKLLAHLACYLCEHQLDTDELTTELDIERLEDGRVDIELKLNFKESINLIPDPDGEFLYEQRRYCLDTPSFDVAESGEVKHA